MKNVQVNTDGLQFDNANGTHTNVNTSATADTYINLPASSGTLALTSQVGGAPIVAYQSATEQVVLSNVMVNSTYLTASLAASTTYMFTAYLMFSDVGATSPDAWFKVTCPAGNTSEFTAFGGGQGDTPYTATGGSGDTLVINNFVPASGFFGATITGRITTTNAGNVVIAFAPASGTTSVSLNAGSWMRLEAVA